MFDAIARFLAAAAVAAAVLACPAAADDADLPTEQSLFEEIAVVSAARISQPISDAPGTISVITRDDLVAAGARTLNDALRLVPGVDVRSLGYFQHNAFRGMGAVEDSKRMLWMIDGRPVNRVIRSDFNSGLAIDVERIEQIEVIRGPGSALYGPNAFSGVVNVITRPPGAASGGALSFAAGNTGLWSPSVDVGWERGAWEYGFSGMVNRWDAYQAHAINDRDFLGQDELDFRAANGPLSISAGYYRVDQGTSMWLSTPATGDESHRVGWYGDVQADWDLSPRSSLALRASSCHDNERMSISGQENTMHERLSLGEALYRVELSPKHSLVLGAEHRVQLGSAPSIGRRRAANCAAFLQDTIKLGPGWTATLGTRCDSHSTYGDVVSPRIALVRHMSERSRIKASYGEAFRAPDYSALYADVQISPTMRAVSNPELKPERLKTFELGASWQAGDRAGVELDLFYTSATDLFARTLTFEPPGTLILRNENRDTATIYGAEISLDLRSRAGRRSFVNYSYQRGRYGGSGAPLEYAPEHKLGVGYAFAIGPGWSATLLYRYVASRRSEVESPMWLPGYGVGNLILRWQAPYGLQYSLGVYNVFDKYYEETYDCPAPKRTWRVWAALRY
jgi:outer membrane receptor protein involved in Fe transport